MPWMTAEHEEITLLSRLSTITNSGVFGLPSIRMFKAGTLDAAKALENLCKE
jgi:hypothetical protein